jgi:DNA-directed RNA polymerase subunit E'/Rpb7
LFFKTALMFGRSDPTKALWFWNPNFEMSEDDVQYMETLPLPDQRAWQTKKLLETPEDERYVIELGEIVRVRVEKEFFHDTGPTRPPKAQLPGSVPVPGEEPEAISPYRIIVRSRFITKDKPDKAQARMNEEGLGVLGWWRGNEEPEAMDED